MVPRRGITPGVDVVVLCLSVFIHTLELVGKKFTYYLYTTRLTELKVLRLDRKIVIRHAQYCIIFTPSNLPDVDFHKVRRYCNVTREVTRYHFFV